MHDNVIHAGLRALLDFEETRSGIPIDFQEVREFDSGDQRALPRVEVRAYMGASKRTVEIPVDDQVFVYEGSWWPYGEEGPDLVTLGEVRVGKVRNQRLFLYLSLEQVFQQAGDERAALARKLFDLLVTPTVRKLAEVTQQEGWQAIHRAYVGMKMGVLDRSVRAWDEELSRVEREVDEKLWNIQELAVRSERLRESLTFHRKLTRPSREREAKAEIAHFAKLVQVGVLGHIEVEGSGLTLIVNPLTIEHHSEEYRLGPFRVHLALQENSIRIFGIDDAARAQGYWHPHVDTHGKPCLGNIGTPIWRAMGRSNLLDVVTALIEFLRSYNPDNPYVRLECWNPDWEDDEDRFESCYEEASARECAHCNEDGCPWRDGAEERCYEDHSRTDCIECGDCGYRRQAMATCREDHEDEPWECTECMTSCTYAGDLLACFNSHRGELCADCPLTECTKRLQTDDQTDEADHDNPEPEETATQEETT